MKNLLPCLLLYYLVSLYYSIDMTQGQDVSVVILASSPLRVVYGTGQVQIACAAFLGLPGSEIEVEWSTNAPDADISNQVDSPFQFIDLKTLTITGVNSDYCGVYNCTETVSSNYSVSESITVDVAPAVAVHPSNVSIGASMLSFGTVTITCSVEGGPGKPLAVVWSGPSNISSPVPLPTNSPAGDVIVSNLALSNIDYSYVGEYTCTTNYTDPDCSGTTESNTASLYIVEAPTILVEPDPVQQRVSIGSSIIYSCSFNASESSSRLSFNENLAMFDVYWAGPDGRINTTDQCIGAVCADRFETEEIVNSTLYLTNVNSSRGGLYTCIAKNIDGIANGSSLLFIDPYIDPMSYNSTVNDTLTIECDVQDFPIHMFRWEKETEGTFQTLDALLSSNGRTVNTTVQTLSFIPVLFGDEGLYRCVVNSSEFGSTRSNSVFVSVSPEGGVTVSPHDQIFEREDNVTLNCTALGGPNNTFIWSNDSGIIAGEVSPTFDLIPVMGGVYTCEVSNAAGTGNATTTVFVHLRFNIHPADIFTDRGTSQLLECEAEAFPSPTYEWFRINGGLRSDLEGIDARVLVFDSVEFGDEGDYYCVATSGNFSLPSDTATLTVSPQGSVSVSPTVHIANFEETITFACTGQGGPNNTYQWFKDDQTLPLDMRANLTLSLVNSTHGGEYTCLVSNAAGNESVTSVLLVLPYFVVHPETEIRTRAESVVNFTCTADGFPLPNITWVKRNVSDANTGLVTVATGDILEFNPVVFGDEGDYFCIASSSIAHANGSIEIYSTQTQATLTVSPEGSVGVAPINTIFNFKDNATFTCTFLGGLNNTITWRKDGQERFSEKDPQLFISELSSSDGGLYTCTVSNAAGSESANTTLLVAPYFIEHPREILATNGTVGNFTCLAEAFPDPTYNWRRTDGRAIRLIVEGKNDSTLNFDPIMFGDEGGYFCDATSSNVTRSSLGAILSVSPDKVEVTALPSDIANFRDKVVLTCTNLGGPNNTYIWLKDGQEVDDETGSNLTLTRVNSTHGGEYTCVVTNSAGRENKTVILNIQPYITVPPEDLVSVENGTNASFVCGVEGFPLPSVAWIKYGGELSQNSSNFVTVSLGEELEFTPVIFGDEGYYACVAFSRTMDGRILADAVSDPPSELAVSPVSTVTISMHNLTYFQDDNTTLHCSSLGGPNNTYQWLKDTDMTVGYGPSLALTDIGAENGGEYTCLVTNNAGNGSDISSLYVHPYLVTLPEPDVHATVKSNVTLTCIADGFPKPNVTWEVLESQFERLEGLDNGPLYFSPVVFNDVGFYRCVASAETPDGVDLQSIASEPSLLTVSPEGSVSVEPTSVVLTRFDNRTFTCTSQGGPNNTYQWQKDGVDLANQTSPLLDVTDVNATDGGVYTCVVTNAAGNESFDSSLYIAPYIVLHPVMDILSANGSNVTFECEAESFPPPEYVWEMSGSESNYASTVQSDGQFLNFEPVEFGDEGYYRCLAYISINITNHTAASQAGLLTISPEGGVTSAPPVHNGERNETVRFICVSEGGPGNTFTWTRTLDGEVLVNSSFLEVNVSGADSGGLYECGVGNRAGSGYVQAVLNVAPEVTIHPTDQNVTITESFSLSCEATGYPVPSITWLHNGSTISITNNTVLSSGSGLGDLEGNVVEDMFEIRSIRSILTVVMTMANNSGHYSCLVASPVSEYEEIMSNPSLILVQATPERPHSVRATSIINESISLIWVEPHHNNAPVLGYQVTFHTPLFLRGDWILINTTVEMTIISGLHPGVVYNFTIVAFNEIGASRPSQVAMVATLDEEPVSSPESLTAIVVNSTQINLEWVELPEEDRRGMIVIYEVMYIPLVTFGRSVEELTGMVNGSGNFTELEVSGLEEDTSYNLSVRAYTSAGPGPYSRIVTSMTLEDVPSDSPMNVSVTVLNSTAMSVQWNKIDPLHENGHIIMYEISYKPITTFNDLLKTLSENTTGNRSIILVNLQEYVEYAISVRGYTNVGPGPYSIPVSGTTSEDVPASAPLEVRSTTQSSTTILVEWEKVADLDLNGVLTVYEVLYMPLYTFGGLISEAAETTNETFLLLENLEEDVEYNISVRAFTVIGPGPYSEHVYNFTFIAAPDRPPENITIDTLSSTQMVVTWDEVTEINQNGPIVLYEVSYIPFDTFNGQLAAQTLEVMVENMSLVLEDLEEFLGYNVSVRAYTEAGPGPYSEPVSNITLEDAPSSTVQDVTAVATSPTTIRVVWNDVSPIDRNGIQILYEIKYMPLTTFDNALQAVNSLNTILKEVELNNLQEYVEYNVSVRSYTVVGSGPYSVEVTTQTFESAPSGPPQNVIVNVVSPTEITVEWNEVLEIDRNGIITEYEILYEPFTTFGGQLPANNSYTVPPLNTNVSIPSLQEYVGYYVTVRASTREGFGPYSGRILVLTEEDVPNSAPINVNATALSPTEILVTWEPPVPIDRNGLILSYEVELRQSTFSNVTNLTFTTFVVSDSFNALTAVRLEEFVTYAIFIRASTRIGTGPSSDPITETTRQAPPSGSPGDLSINTTGPNSLNVSWMRPIEVNINGILTIYSIEYHILNIPSSSERVNVTGSTLSLELTGLNNYTTYTVSVAAYTPAGEGPPITQENRTEENVPGGPPLDVRAQSNSFESILVQWSPPTEDFLYGILRGYLIRYINNDDPGSGYMYNDSILDTDRSFIIERLLQFTNYSVEVAAVTIGDGVYSDPVSVTTNQDKPSSYPVNVEVDSLTDPKSIQVIWDEIPRSDRNGIILKYDVKYEPQNTFGGLISDSNVNMTRTERRIVLKNLEEATYYNVSVRGYTVVGSGPYSPVVTHLTNEGIPTGFPRSLYEASEKTSRTLTVEWEDVEEIDQNGNIIGYSIQYGAVEDDTGTTASVEADVLYYNATNLTPGSVYYFRVAAATSQGTGDYSDEIYPETLEERPGVVDNVEKIERFTSITISWDRPQEPNGKLVIYDVMYNTTPNEVPTVTEVQVATPWYLHDNLKTGENVTFAVRAHTRIGPGNYTRIDAGTRNKPPQVKNVTVVMEDANTVRVLWNRLTGVDAEHVVSYSVTYRFDDNGEELVALFPADVSYGRISGLVSGEEYLFRVSAIADIEGDTIEGDKSETDIDSFHPVPATVPPDPLPSIQLSTSVIGTIIFVVCVYTVILFVVIFTRKCRSKNQTPALEFENGNNNYESLEMFGRELPDIPRQQTRSRGSTLGSTLGNHMNQPYKSIPLIKQQPSGRQGNHDSIIELTVPGTDDIYDNDVPPTPSHQQQDPHYNPYVEANPKKPTAMQPKAKQRATVIQNETYESVVETQLDAPEEFYDTDPFERELSVRRGSNPNIYSEVRKLDGHPSLENTRQSSSVVLTNPAFEPQDEDEKDEYLEVSGHTNPTFEPQDEDEKDEYLEVSGHIPESVLTAKPLPTAQTLTPPHMDFDPNGEEGEMYEDMAGNTSPLPNDSPSMEGGDHTSPTTSGADVGLVEERSSNDRGSYFLFGEHYDNIMSSQFADQVEEDLERCDSYQDMSGSSTADWGISKQDN